MVISEVEFVESQHLKMVCLMVCLTLLLRTLTKTKTDDASPFTPTLQK